MQRVVFRKGPGAEAVIAPGELRGLFRRDVHAHDFVVGAHVRGEVDRLAVLAPRRVLDAVVHVRQQDLRRTAGGGHQEQLVVVVNLALFAGSRGEQHGRAIRRERGVAFRHLVVGQLPRVRSARIHHPHFDAVHEFEQRAGAALHHDPFAVRAQLVAVDVPVALGHARGLALEIRRPDVPLLEIVLLERIHIVEQAIALALFGRLGIRGDEVDRLAVRRPRQRAGRGCMAGEAARFAALDTQQVDLIVGVGVATRRERDQLAVRRPARARFAALAKRQLHLSGAVGVDAIDVADPAIRFPVRLVDREQQLLAVRRELRVADNGLFDGVDERPAELFLGAKRRIQQDADDDRQGAAKVFHGVRSKSRL